MQSSTGVPSLTVLRFRLVSRRRRRSSWSAGRILDDRRRTGQGQTFCSVGSCRFDRRKMIPLPVSADVRLLVCSRWVPVPAAASPFDEDNRETWTLVAALAGKGRPLPALVSHSWWGQWQPGVGRGERLGEAAEALRPGGAPEVPQPAHPAAPLQATGASH